VVAERFIVLVKVNWKINWKY